MLRRLAGSARLTTGNAAPRPQRSGNSAADGLRRLRRSRRHGRRMWSDLPCTRQPSCVRHSSLRLRRIWGAWLAGCALRTRSTLSNLLHWVILVPIARSLAHPIAVGGVRSNRPLIHRNAICSSCTSPVSGYRPFLMGRNAVCCRSTALSYHAPSRKSTYISLVSLVESVNITTVNQFVTTPLTNPPFCGMLPLTEHRFYAGGVARQREAFSFAPFVFFRALRGPKPFVLPGLVLTSQACVIELSELVLALCLHTALRVDVCLARILSAGTFHVRPFTHHACFCTPPLLAPTPFMCYIFIYPRFAGWATASSIALYGRRNQE